MPQKVPSLPQGLANPPFRWVREQAGAGHPHLQRLEQQLPSFLPGRLVLGPGATGDYRLLERFHYRGRRPATWAAVLCVRHIRAGGSQTCDGRIVAVAVLSWPTAVSRPRREVFGLGGDYATQIRFANANVRTISRVIVHPQFRGLGLARILIEGLCAICPTRYATAAMGEAHPMFERAGMKRHERVDGGPAYYWLDLGPMAVRARNMAVRAGGVWRAPPG